MKNCAVRPNRRCGVAALLMLTLLACKKSEDSPLKGKTNLLIDKKWDLKVITAVDIDGMTVNIPPDTVEYNVDNYYSYTADGKYQLLDGELKTPNRSSDIIDQGRWQWKADGDTLWMLSEALTEPWLLKITTLTEDELRFDYRPAQSYVTMKYHYLAKP
jgi:hypothetical protein